MTKHCNEESLHTREGRLKEAEQLYLAILHTKPDHPDANHNLGVLAVSVNKAEALTRFRNALTTNAAVEQFWISYVNCLITAEKFADARVALADAKHAGVLEEQLISLEQALQSARRSSEQPKVRQIDAGDLETRAPSQKKIELLFEHYQSNQLEEFEKLAIAMTKEYPNHQIGWKALGTALRRTGRIVESLEPFETLCRSITPQDAESQSNLGCTLLELGRLAEAEVRLREALRVNPEFAEAHYNLGNALQELGEITRGRVKL